MLKCEEVKNGGWDDDDGLSWAVSVVQKREKRNIKREDDRARGVESTINWSKQMWEIRMK